MNLRYFSLHPKSIMHAVNKHCCQVIAASRYYQGDETIQKGNPSLLWKQSAVFLVGFHCTNWEILSKFFIRYRYTRMTLEKITKWIIHIVANFVCFFFQNHRWYSFKYLLENLISAWFFVIWSLSKALRPWSIWSIGRAYSFALDCSGGGV